MRAAGCGEGGKNTRPFGRVDISGMGRGEGVCHERRTPKGPSRMGNRRGWLAGWGPPFPHAQGPQSKTVLPVDLRCFRAHAWTQVRPPTVTLGKRHARRLRPISLGRASTREEGGVFERGSVHMEDSPGPITRNGLPPRPAAILESPPPLSMRWRGHLWCRHAKVRPEPEVDVEAPTPGRAGNILPRSR